MNICLRKYLTFNKIRCYTVVRKAPIVTRKKAGMATRTPELNASQKVELYIKEAIYHGALKPRERIIELELAKQIGYSRAPVREAVLRLVREGLMVTVPRRGTFVRDFSPEAIEEIFEMRAKLEGVCVRHLRRRMTGKEEAALRACLRDLETACRKGDQEDFLKADVKLHRTIWRLSHCKEIYRILNSLMIPFILMVARSTSAKVPMEEALQHHRDYIATVLTSPPERVEHDVERYFLRIYEKLFCSKESKFKWRNGSVDWLLEGVLD